MKNNGKYPQGHIQDDDYDDKNEDGGFQKIRRKKKDHKKDKPKWHRDRDDIEH